MPGLVAPSSGPIMWTMPWSRILHVEELDAEFGAVLAQRVDLRVGDLVGDDEAVVRGGGGDVVVDGGDVRSGRRSLRPARRRPSNAWGEVTSWTRWRSM